MITKHGVPVALLVPPDASFRQDPDAVLRWMRDFRGEHGLDGVTIRELIDADGRR